MFHKDLEWLDLVWQIAPTDFKTFKTEALFGEFIWVDDAPTAYEFQFLSDQELLHGWWEANTRRNINDLEDLILRLKSFAVSETDVTTNGLHKNRF